MIGRNSKQAKTFLVSPKYQEDLSPYSIEPGWARLRFSDIQTLDCLSHVICCHVACYAPALRVGALSDDARLSSVCLLRTSDLSREQRGLGRLKLAQR